MRFGIMDSHSHPKTNGELFDKISSIFSPKIAAFIREWDPQLSGRDIPIRDSTLELVSILLNHRVALIDVIDIARQHNVSSVVPFTQEFYSMWGMVGQNGMCAILTSRWLMSKAENTDFLNDFGYDWGRIYTDFNKDEADDIYQAFINYRRILPRSEMTDASWLDGQSDFYKAQKNSETRKDFYDFLDDYVSRSGLKAFSVEYDLNRFESCFHKGFYRIDMFDPSICEGHSISIW